MHPASQTNQISSHKDALKRLKPPREIKARTAIELSEIWTKMLLDTRKHEWLVAPNAKKNIYIRSF